MAQTITAPVTGAQKPLSPPNPALFRIRDLIYQEAGIFHPDTKLRLLEDRCTRRMREIGVATIRDYQDCLSGAARKTELVALLNEITIGETCFFRNQPQLDAFRKIVLPKICEAKAGDSGPLRVWSAGCSTGEEPYTLSIILLEQAAALKNRQFEVYGTDLNQASLAHARQAIYGDYSIRNLDPLTRNKYFLPAGESLQVCPRVQSAVRLSRLNLLDHAGMAAMHKMDVIFCCNVLIYFDRASKAQVIKLFHDNLLPHGYLFIGHSESLYGVNDDFRLVHLPSATAYVKNSRLPASQVKP